MKKEKGFTLLEITVVVIIIALLATIFLANYRQREGQFALKRSAHKLSQDLRIAEDMALVGERIYNVFPAGGYGIYFDTTISSSTYMLFADCDGHGDYIPGANTCPGNNQELIKEISLEEGIQISAISPGSPIAITFFPPEPKVTIQYGLTTATSTTITLTSGSQTKTVTIYTSGLIDVD